MVTLREVTTFCQSHNMAESRFGRLAVNDPRLVSEMRKGVQITEKKAQKIRGFMESYQNEE